MSNYTYLAVNAAGKRKKGGIEAASLEKAQEFLKMEGLTPIKVAEQGVLDKEINFGITGRVKPRDLSVFCRQFVSILNAGVTVTSALEMLSEQTKNKKLQQAISDTKNGIEKGETLSEAMRSHSDVFPDLLINMVEAGEASGSLETSFERMATHFEKSAKLSGIMKKAMIYPCAIAIVATIVIIIMLVFVIPQFQDMFDEMGTKMPAITVAVVNASNFLIHKWYICVGVVALVITIFQLYRTSEQGKIVFAKIGLRAPLLGALTVKSSSARLARTLSTLMSSGIPLVNAIDITAKSMSNLLVKQALIHSKEEVEKGVPLSEPIKASGVFPPLVHHMIRIGEETGGVDHMLDKVADYYDEEVELQTQTLTAAMEPIIILVLAAIVCVIIAAVMSPMLSMYSGMEDM
ncbi:type II secretion system F family protein [Anaerosporobacter faecicola]|uniref:type II secretion system F family protein n=1 Tax=Anaerosporobacter faecicola TaxID=2718714 RepID=UPI00143AC26E|nr:type II secretion system F family protein [Anaerosporobacter faecicola]